MQKMAALHIAVSRYLGRPGRVAKMTHTSANVERILTRTAYYTSAKFELPESVLTLCQVVLLYCNYINFGP